MFLDRLGTFAEQEESTPRSVMTYQHSFADTASHALPVAPRSSTSMSAMISSSELEHNDRARETVGGAVQSSLESVITSE